MFHKKQIAGAELGGGACAGTLPPPAPDVRICLFRVNYPNTV